MNEQCIGHVTLCSLIISAKLTKFVDAWDWGSVVGRGDGHRNKFSVSNPFQLELRMSLYSHWSHMCTLYAVRRRTWHVAIVYSLSFVVLRTNSLHRINEPLEENGKRQKRQIKDEPTIFRTNHSPSWAPLNTLIHNDLIKNNLRHHFFATKTLSQMNQHKSRLCRSFSRVSEKFSFLFVFVFVYSVYILSIVVHTHTHCYMDEGS